jgi:hypothetical protein
MRSSIRCYKEIIYEQLGNSRHLSIDLYSINRIYLFGFLAIRFLEKAKETEGMLIFSLTLLFPIPLNVIFAKSVFDAWES